MAIAFDAFSGGFVSGTSLTVSHTTGTLTNGVLVVSVSANGSSGDQISGVTYNGVSMVRMISQQTAALGIWTYFYVLVNPSPGTHNIVVSAAASFVIRAANATYSGVSQVVPQVGATGNYVNPGTSVTVAVNVTTSNCWLVSAVQNDSALAETPSGGLTTTRGNDGGTVLYLADSNGIVTTGTQNATWTSSSQKQDAVAMALVPATYNLTPIELNSSTLSSDANLTHYYRMEGNSNDSKGALNGTDTSITYSTGNGKFGQGAGFNGTTSTIAFSSAMGTGTGSFTIAAWIKTSTTGTRQTILSYGASSTNNGAILFVNTSNVVELDLSNTQGPSGNQVITDGQWHFVAAVNNGNIIQVYVDGRADGIPVTMAPNISAGTSNIGKDFFGATGFFNGAIDDVSVFSRVLTGSELSYLYQQSVFKQLASTSLFSDANLVAYYKLEDTSDSKSTHTLTNVNTVPFNNAMFNKGADLTSNTNKYLHNNDGFLASTGGALSISYWANSQSTANSCIWSAASGTYEMYGLTLSHNLAIHTNDATNTGHDLTANGAIYYNSGFNHVCFVAYQNGSNYNVELWVNGIEVASGTITGATLNSLTGEFDLGRFEFENTFGIGIIDDCAFFNRRLLAADIAILYATPSTTTGAAFLYNFVNG